MTQRIPVTQLIGTDEMPAGHVEIKSVGLVLEELLHSLRTECPPQALAERRGQGRCAPSGRLVGAISGEAGPHVSRFEPARDRRLDARRRLPGWIRHSLLY